MRPLRPYTTCRDALQHLGLPELGRPVHMKLRAKGQDGRKNGGDETRLSKRDKPAKVVTTKDQYKGGQIMLVDVPAAKAPFVPNGGDVSMMSRPDEPARVVLGHETAKGGQILIAPPSDGHPPARIDGLSPTIRSGGSGHSAPNVVMAVPEPRDRHPTSDPGAPARTLHAEGGREGRRESVLAWPWDRPSTTIQGDERLGVPGHHDPKIGNSQHKGANAVILSERAAAILQNFPDGECTGHRMADDDGIGLVKDDVRPGTRCPTCGEIRRWHFAGDTKAVRWGQIGQAMCPKLGEVVGLAIVEQMRAVQKDETKRKNGLRPSGDDGEALGAQAAVVEGRPPQERRQSRQQDPELRGDDEEAPRSAPHGDQPAAQTVRDLPADVRSRPAPQEAGQGVRDEVP